MKDENVTEQYKAMARSDAQQTRAKSASKAMRALIWITGAFVSAIVYVYVTKGAEEAFSVEMTAVFLAMTGTFTYIVRAYFNDLKSEARSRHQTVDEKAQPMSAVAAMVSRKN